MLFDISIQYSIKLFILWLAKSAIQDFLMVLRLLHNLGVTSASSNFQPLLSLLLTQKKETGDLTTLHSSGKLGYTLPLYLTGFFFVTHCLIAKPHNH